MLFVDAILLKASIREIGLQVLQTFNKDKRFCLSLGL